MPLDTASTYGQTLLRTDGRRWNELRRISASISTQSSTDGSSQFVMGHTVVVCSIIGPREGYVDHASCAKNGTDPYEPGAVSAIQTMPSSRPKLQLRHLRRPIGEDVRKVISASRKYRPQSRRLFKHISLLISTPEALSRYPCMF